MTESVLNHILRGRQNASQALMLGVAVALEAIDLIPGPASISELLNPYSRPGAASSLVFTILGVIVSRQADRRGAGGIVLDLRNTGRGMDLDPVAFAHFRFRSEH